MNNIALPRPPASKSRLPESVSPRETFRTPHFDLQTLADALQLVVYVPGVEPCEVEIATRGPDLTVTARKAHYVRTNWQSLHLEGVQRDYLLNLRLGRSLDYKALQAELREGVLTIRIPKLDAAVTVISPESGRLATG